MPEDKIVVLGLFTTKSGRRETPAELTERIREAEKFVPLDRLALSPQCGFATSVKGNDISFEEQGAKLKVIAETAKQLWA